MTIATNGLPWHWHCKGCGANYHRSGKLPHDTANSYCPICHTMVVKVYEGET